MLVKREIYKLILDGPLSVAASVSVCNKLEDGEHGDINYRCLRKHRESAESYIGAKCIVFWNLFHPQCARFDTESAFR
jgi:hypothetical protein